MTNLPIELECAKAQQQRDHYAQACGAEIMKNTKLRASLLKTADRMQEWLERGGGPAFKETQRMVRSEMEFWIADARKEAAR